MSETVNSSGFEHAIAQLSRAKSLSKALKRVSQASAEAPVRFEHFTDAFGGPFFKGRQFRMFMKIIPEIYHPLFQVILTGHHDTPGSTVLNLGKISQRFGNLLFRIVVIV